MDDTYETLNSLARAAAILDHVLNQAFEHDEGSPLRAVAELAMGSLHSNLADLIRSMEAPAQITH